MLPLVFLLASCSIFDYHLGVGTPVEAGSLSRSPSTAGGVDYDAPTTVWLGLSYSPSSHKYHRESMEQRERHALMRLGTERYASHGDITVTVDAEGGYTATEIEVEADVEVDASAVAALDLPARTQDSSEAADGHIVTTVTETIPVDWSGGVGVLLWCVGVSMLLLVLKHIGFFRWFYNRRKRDAE